MGNIKDKAMLIRFNVSQWTARKYDKGATAKVSNDYGNATEAARVNKTLIAQEAIKKVSSKANDARTFHYKNTLPWNDDGARILPAANYLEYTSNMRQFKADFEAAVNELVDNYPALIEDARIILNGLFEEEDYPKPSQIIRKYNFSTAVDPLPDASDFRVDLQSEEVKQIQAQIENRLQAATAEAMQDLWQRLFASVSAMVERLSDPNAIFRDSLTGNIEELVSLLPRMNLTDDPNLEAMRRTVEAKLLKDPQTLREDKEERKQTADEAKAILDAMSAFMGN